MIQGFELHVLDADNQTDLEYEIIKEAWQMLAKHYKDLWW